eukprot:gene4667-8239_t
MPDEQIYFPSSTCSHFENNTYFPPQSSKVNLDYDKYRNISSNETYIYDSNDNSIDSFKEISVIQKSKFEFKIFDLSFEMTILNELLSLLFERKNGKFKKSSRERDYLLDYILERFNYSQIEKLIDDNIELENWKKISQVHHYSRYIFKNIPEFIGTFSNDNIFKPTLKEEEMSEMDLQNFKLILLKCEKMMNVSPKKEIYFLCRIFLHKIEKYEKKKKPLQIFKKCFQSLGIEFNEKNFIEIHELLFKYLFEQYIFKEGVLDGKFLQMTEL